MKRFYDITSQKALRTFKAFKKNAGFTLIEIMIVVAIIGILSAIVGPQIFNNIQKARVTAAKSQIQAFEQALAMYNLTNATFPTTGEGLQVLVQGGFMRKIPDDPWGNPFIYRSPGEGGREFDIISYGRDGQPGGEGFNADITSWD